MPTEITNTGLGDVFHEKKAHGRNTSLSPAYERVNERAKWFGRRSSEKPQFEKRERIMKKSFAAFFVVVGISAVGTASTAFAGGKSSHGNSSHASSSHSSSSPGHSTSHSQGSSSSHPSSKHNSCKYDHCWDSHTSGMSGSHSSRR